MSKKCLSPILQFGTSRFLQAHVDLFVSEALPHGRALGKITVVQTTDSVDSKDRVKALELGGAYPVKIQGVAKDLIIDLLHWSTSIETALYAKRDWKLIRQGFPDVQVVISNTGDRGYALDERDTNALLDAEAEAPRSFPAKLLVLLYDRWLACPDASISLFPCELISKNGTVLGALVRGLAQDWAIGTDFVKYLNHKCIWVNSLVDRIVSEAIKPVGAVAEPYAIWAIEDQKGLQLPCTHPSIQITNDLAQYEQLKLFTLNLSHTYIAEKWLSEGRSEKETIYEAMSNPILKSDLKSLWDEEVLPVFKAMGKLEAARDYISTVQDRLMNPFLHHRIADIAQNHTEKKRRRILPLINLAVELAPDLEQPRLRAAMASN